VTLDVENLEDIVQSNGILSDLEDAVPVYNTSCRASLQKGHPKSVIGKL